MKSLPQIQQELAAGQFDFSRHAFRRMVERNISDQEIREAGANRLRSRTRRRSSRFMSQTQMNGSKAGNGGSHV